MIDMHSHILPGIDDGARNIDEAIDMAREAVKEGIEFIYATPHHGNGKYMNEASAVIMAVKQLNIELQQREIPLTIMPGQEIRIYENLINDFCEERIIPLHNSSYILLEFPPSHIPPKIDELIHEFQVLGVVPIIAHPERNQEIIEKPDKLLRLVEQGALSQVTSHSITGLFGKNIKKMSLEICRRRLVHFIASDAHNVSHRPFGLREAYQVIDREIDLETSQYYRDNASSLMHSLEIHMLEPQKKARRWFSYRNQIARKQIIRRGESINEVEK